MKRTLVSLLLLFTATLLPAAEPGAGANTPKNLLQASENFNAAAWLGFSKNANVTNNAEAAPDGTQTAAHVVIKNGYMGQIIRKAQPGHAYVFSAWMKAGPNGTENATLAGENNNPAQVANFVPCPLTPEWKRYSVSLKCPAEGNFNFRFSFRGADFFMWHPQVEDVTGQAEEPTDYEAAAGPAIPKVQEAPANAAKVKRTGPQNIACWGDSLTQGAGGKAFTLFLQEYYAGKPVFNGGVGGEKSPQIKTRFMAGQAKWGDVTVIWAGRNNYEHPEEVEADVAAMVSKLQTKRYLVLGVLNMNREVKDSGPYKVIKQLNSDLAKMFPANFIDIRTALVAAYDANNPQDVQDHENDVPPTSLRSDGIHLNTAGYEFVAKHVAEFFKSKNWFTESDKGEE